MKGERSTRPLSGLSGFTLLELAVAAGLGALLLTAVAVLGTRGMSAWRRVDGRLQALFQVEKGLSRMEEELRNGAAPADRPFHGVKGEIAFTFAEGPTRLREVTYRLLTGPSGRSAWVRQWKLFPDPDGKEPETETLMRGVTQFSLQYGTVAEAEGQKILRWVESWDDLGEGTKGIPKIVRVRLEGTDAGGRAFSVTRDVWIPQGVWMAASHE